MTENKIENQVPQTENKQNDKEYNFRAIEARLKKSEEARFEAEKKADEALRIAQEAQKRQHVEDDDNDDEPYIDKKKLDKKMASFERKLEERFEKKVDERAMQLIQRKEDEDWLRNNGDFEEIMREDNLTKFVQKAPAVAESIKRMPDGFEKQKLVYNAIKSMGLDKPEAKQSSVQDKIDANRRSPYYQPSGVGAAPYNSVGDFSPTGQKNAYTKMQELKNRLRG